MKVLLKLSVALLLLTPITGQAQLEIGNFLGLSNYTGEMSGEPGKYHFEPLEYNLAAGVFTRLNFNKYMAVRAQLTRGKISGSDFNAINPHRRIRNLNFRSTVYEASLQVELNLLGHFSKPGNINTPYLFIGMGAVHFKPQGFLDGNWHALQPLGTEGQGQEGYPERYKLFSMVIPMGVGFRYSINKFGNLGIELGLRKTFTDYLDDVSTVYPDIDLLEQYNELAADLSYRIEPTDVNDFNRYNPVGQKRGNPETDDWYMFIGATLSISFPDLIKVDY